MKLEDKQTGFLFEELNEWGTNLNSLDSSSIVEKREKYLAGEITKDDLLGYSKKDLLNSPPEVKELALKIVNDKLKKFSSLIIKSAENNFNQDNVSVPLIGLAWTILKENTEKINVELGGEKTAPIATTKINNYLELQTN
jgi:hypothetical protein